MDSSESIGVYGEAKAEYTRQLCNLVVPALESYFLDLLASTKETEKDPKRVLWVFQDSLKQFPDWNMDKVQRETTKISDGTKCDYLEEILTAVFIAHTKVLSAIRLTSKNKKLQITIPKLQHFLHRTMSECARLLWSNAYLFNDAIPAIERQKNLRQVEQLLHEAVLQSIRGMLPVKSILKEYLSDETDDTVAADDAQTDAVEPVIEDKPEEEEAKVEEEKPEEDKPEEEEAKVEEVKPEEDKFEEVKPEEVKVEEVKVEEEKPEEVKVEEAKVEEAKPEEVKAPTIMVDTEPSVSFTNLNTIFHYNPDKNSIDQHMEQREESIIDGITIDESSPPEDLDEYEELGNDDSIPFAENEFESL